MKTKYQKFPVGTLFIITWDQDSQEANKNHVYTLLLGSMVSPHTSDATPHTHYSLVKSVEHNWSLPTLKTQDESSNLIALEPELAPKLPPHEQNSTLPFEIPMEFRMVMIIASSTSLGLCLISCIMICCCVDTIRNACCCCCIREKIVYVRSDREIPLKVITSPKRGREMREKIGEKLKEGGKKIREIKASLGNVRGKRREKIEKASLLTKNGDIVMLDTEEV